MLARVERGMARPGTARRPRERERIGAMSWPKIVLATLATAGTLTVSALTVVAVLHTPDPPRNPTAAAPSAAGRAAPPTEDSRAADGPLWADGSVDPHSNAYWAQSNITLKTGKPLTALVVELRIALAEGVKHTGSWRTRPAADFDLSAREEGGFLVYRWTLKPGRTVPSGEYVFAGQYDHAAGCRRRGARSRGVGWVRVGRLHTPAFWQVGWQAGAVAAWACGVGGGSAPPQRCAAARWPNQWPRLRGAARPSSTGAPVTGRASSWWVIRSSRLAPTRL